jgi:thymidylate synthase ThyX
MTRDELMMLAETPTNPITARIVEDSISADNIRIVSLQCRYPRIIHAELMTHRVFSRNARSSRAVPTERLLSETPFIPHMLQNRPGMQALEEMDLQKRLIAEEAWRYLAEHTKGIVKALHALGVHKQWANRPLEWFGYIDTLVTSTDWANFFALRTDSGAQPEFRMLAEEIQAEMALSVPTYRKPGEWHLPYITDEDRDSYNLDVLQKLSVARCARLSYRPFDGGDSIVAELQRYERLVVSRPVHASPAEHQATPDTWCEGDFEGYGAKWYHSSEHGNFTGWRQYRKMLPNESVPDNRHGR